MATETEQLLVSLEARVRDFERNFQRASRTADTQFSAIERRAKASADRLERSLRSSTANINGMLGTIGIGLGFNELREFADAWTEAGNKVHSAAAATGVQVRSLQDLKKGANDARVSLEDYVDLYARMVRSASGVAKSEEEIGRATAITAKAFKAGGASAQEQAAGILQLGQALGSGVLGGDELRSVRENAPVLAKAIADEFGVSIAGLKKLGEEGKLTSDRVFQAILKAQATVEKQFSATNPTLGDAFTKLRNEFTAFVGELNESEGVTTTVGAALNKLADNIGVVAGGAAAAAAVLLSRFAPALARMAVAQAAAVLTNPWLLLATVIGGAAVALGAFGDQVQPVSGELANLQDYAGAAWESIKAGATEAAQVAADAFMQAVDLISKALGGTDVSMADLAEFAKEAANDVIGAFVLIYDTILTTFTKLPPAVAEAALDAINGLIGSVESGLNTVVAGVNAAVQAINSVGDRVGVTLGEIGSVTLGRITNEYTGAGQAAGEAYINGLKDATKDRVGEALGFLRERANQRAQQRAADEAQRKADAERKKNAPIPGGGATSPAAAGKANDYDREVASIQKRISLMTAETAARRNATGTYEEQQAAVERAKTVQQLLNAAQEAGLTVTPDLTAKINSLADAYSLASEEARKLAKSQQEAAQRSRELEDASRDSLKGFVSDVVKGKSPTDALYAALGRLSDKMLDMALDGLWEGVFGPSRGNNAFSLLGGALTPKPTATPGAGIAAKAASPLATTVPAALRDITPAPIDKVERGPIVPLTAGGAMPKGSGFAQAAYEKALAAGLPDPQARLAAAQATLESRSGKSGLATSTNNLFGIKAGPNWRGETARFRTREEDPSGRSYYTMAPFRKYGDTSESFRDYGDLVRRRWPDAYNAPTFDKAVEGLRFGRPGGYATDKRYGEKLSAINAQLRPATAPAGDQAAKLAQAQTDAQKRLADQMTATTRTTAQTTPSLASMSAGVSGLDAPLNAAVPSLSNFSSGITNMLSSLGGAGGVGAGIASFFAGGGHVTGPGSGTSDSIPAFLSDGEYVVNAKATKKNRGVLEAINSGKAPRFAAGGIVNRSSMSASQTYAPSVSINLARGSSGDSRQDARYVRQIADAVGASLSQSRPDSFRKTEPQRMAEASVAMARAARRNN